MGGPDEAFGGEGSDECDGFATEHSCGPEESPPGNGTFVILNQGLDGSSLIVQGDASPNHIVVYFNGGWTVTNDGPLVAGEGCAVDGTAAPCTCPTSIATGLVVITGGGGDDSRRHRPERPGRASRSGSTATPAPTRSAAGPATTCWKPARTTTAPTTATTP